MSESCKTSGGKKRRSRWLFRTAVFVVVAAIGVTCAHVVIAHVVGPQIIRSRVAQQIARSWGGDIDVRDVQFRYSGVMDVARVGLRDRDGRQIVELRGISLTLGDWPSMKAVPVAIGIDAMNIRLPSDGNKIDIPLKKPEKISSAPNKKPRLKVLEVSSIDVVGERGRESRTLFSSLSFELTSDGDLLKFDLRDASTGSDSVSVEGQLARGTSVIDVTVKLNRFISRDEADILLPLFGAGEQWGGAGRFAVGIKFDGDLSDVNSIQPSGIVRLSNCSIYKEKALVAERLGTTGRVNGRRVDFEECRGQFCGGQVSGRLWGEYREPNGVVWGGDIFADQLDNDDLVEFFGGTGGQSRGRGSMRLEFELVGTDRHRLQATGSVFLDDADMGGVPVVRHVFTAVGLSEIKPLEMSDAAGEFSVTNGLLRVKRGQISNHISAVEIEQGGTLDLVTGDIDVYAVGILLKYVPGIVQRIPVIRLFQDFKDKLVRVHVKGNVSQPVKDLLKKEPIEDISEGTSQFIISIAKSGGRLTHAVLSSLGFLLSGDSGDSTERDSLGQD